MSQEQSVDNLDRWDEETELWREIQGQANLVRSRMDELLAFNIRLQSAGRFMSWILRMRDEPPLTLDRRRSESPHFLSFRPVMTIATEPFTVMAGGDTEQQTPSRWNFTLAAPAPGVIIDAYGPTHAYCDFRQAVLSVAEVTGGEAGESLLTTPRFSLDDSGHVKYLTEGGDAPWAQISTPTYNHPAKSADLAAERQLLGILSAGRAAIA